MTERIRTTHVGSLPRPPALRTLLAQRETGQLSDTAALNDQIATAVESIVARQRQIGLDIVNDGEMSKISYATYVKYRFSGIRNNTGAPRQGLYPADVERFPAWASWINSRASDPPFVEYECHAPLEVSDTAPLFADVANLRTAAEKASAGDVFMTAASPGIIASYIPNRYYSSHGDYLAALVDVLRPEYEAIVGAGFTLQLDCPDLSSWWTPGLDDAQRDARKHQAVDAINAATVNIDPRRMRMHLCWGNYEGPHDHDLPLASLLPIALRARPGAISFEGANPRHEHEWELFDEVDLPDDKVIIPGVIDSTTNFIEHPQLVAQRIRRYVDRVGAERVIAGVDCGFGTFALQPPVDPDIAFAKLQALVDGAAIASQR